MADKIITTSGGYKATLAPFLTYDQFVEIKKIWTSDVMIDPDEPKIELSKVSVNLLYVANKKAVGFLVKRIEDAEGNVIERGEGELPIPPGDGQEVMEVVGQIAQEASDSFDKKKATTS